MQERAKKSGHCGEEAWTNTDLDHWECTSSMAHVIGVAVGHCALQGAKAQTPSRKNHCFLDFKWGDVPPIFRIPDASKDKPKGESSAAASSSQPMPQPNMRQPSSPSRSPSPDWGGQDSDLETLV